jgi:hypothetical protein
LFGPGVGELVAIRAPPDDWLLIDGCAARKVAYGPQLVAHYGIRPKLVVLTHPHRDHSRGVAEVVERATDGVAKKDWPKLGMLFPPPRKGTPLDDLQRYFEEGDTEQAVSTILRRWQLHPACRWRLDTGSTEPLGEATVSVLSPEAAARQQAFEAWQGKLPEFNWNVAATALLVEWRGQVLLLGSDLVEQPGDGWTHALARTPGLARQTVYKVAHHGSLKAQHRGVLKGAKSRKSLFIATPFASENLPRFSKGEGMELLHDHASVVHLSALPRAYGEQAGAPLEFTRSHLAGRADDLEFDPPAPGFPDCYIMLSFPPAGGTPRIEYGAGSVKVLANASPKKRPRLGKGGKRKASNSRPRKRAGTVEGRFGPLGSGRGG